MMNNATQISFSQVRPSLPQQRILEHINTHTAQWCIFTGVLTSFSPGNSLTFLKSPMTHNPITLTYCEAVLALVQCSAENRKQSFISLYLQRSLNTVTCQLLSHAGLYLCGPQ